MRKYLISVLSTLLICICVAVTGCSAFNAKAESGGFSYAYNTISHAAGITEFVPNSFDIIIPDSLDDCKVVSLGGFYGRGVPLGFSLNLGGSDLHIGSAELPASKLTQINPDCSMLNEVRFTLHLGQNIERIEGFEDKYWSDPTLDALIIYHPVFYVEVDEDNPTFYSKDGKVYRYKDDSLLDSIPYWSED